MSDEPDPPRPPDDGEDEGSPGEEPEAEAPPTDYERLLVEQAGDVVSICARALAQDFPRHIGPRALMSLGDLLSLGHEALYRAARVYDETKNPNFPAFARYYVRGAMLNALDDLLFHERVKRAGAQAADNFAGHFRDHDYNVMKHDEAEARRRFRSFANGLLAATFVAGLHAAQQHLDEADTAERLDYERALLALRAALSKLSVPERTLLNRVYGKSMSLRNAAATLTVPYPTARARHSRALAILHDLLVEQGIRGVPRPLVGTYVGDLLDEGPAPVNDTGTEGA